jgi:hypothetical protein
MVEHDDLRMNLGLKRVGVCKWAVRLSRGDGYSPRLSLFLRILETMKKTVFLFLGIALLTTLAIAQQITGGFGNADIKNPEVIAAAKYALAVKNYEMKRSGTRAYTLLEIEKAQTQVVAGLNYRVCIKVKLGSILRTADALVYQNLQQEYSLSSWTWDKCSIK